MSRCTTNIRYPFFAILAALADPLDDAYKLTDDLGHVGRCNAEGGAAYNSWWINLSNFDENVEGCGLGCLSFRAPGFVGFQFNANNCLCLYSAGTIPDQAPDGWTISRYGNGEGPITTMDTSASFITCYRVKDYYATWEEQQGI